MFMKIVEIKNYLFFLSIHEMLKHNSEVGILFLENQRHWFRGQTDRFDGVRLQQLREERHPAGAALSAHPLARSLRQEHEVGEI